MHHCPDCSVEWRGDIPCWMRGGEGLPDEDKSSPWANGMASEPLMGSWDRAERRAESA